MAKQIADFQTIALNLGKVFKPTAPIRKDDLFQGRTTQVREVVDAINQPGKHVVLYGEAGVGKTSLGQILKTKLSAMGDEAVISPLINCDSSDNYTSIWKKLFDQIQDEYADMAYLFGGGEPGEPPDETGDDLAGGTTVVLIGNDSSPPLTPRDVRKQLEPLAKHGIVYVILDEFDKVTDKNTRPLMADTIKLFSDREVPVTIILIGVAPSVTGLIEDHRSIERCLAQVHMPRMPFRELVKIVNVGLSTVGMTIESDALEEIAGLSRGLPHYTHLLALNASRCALDDSKLKVSRHHVNSALKTALSQTNESIRHKYDEATFSTKKNTLHRHVLLSCAVADCDEFGYFQPGDVIDPLATMKGEKFTTDRFSTHLNKFCEIQLLRRDGGDYRWRYHFANPLMQPYVIMKGLEEGLIKRDQLNFSEEKYPLFVKQRPI